MSPADLVAGIAARPLFAVVLVGAVVALPTLATAQLSVAESRGQLRAELLAGQSRAAEVGAELVAQRLDDVRQQLTAAAAGRFVQLAATRGDAALMSSVLGEFRPLLSQADVEHLFFLGPDGGLLAADPPVSQLPDLTSERKSALNDAVGAGQPFLSEVFLSTLPGAPPSVFVAVPVRDGLGALAGSLVAAIDLRRSAAWLGPVRAIVSDVYLVDAAGRLIVRASRPGTDALRDLATEPTVRAGLRGVQISDEAADPLGGDRALIATALVDGPGWVVIALQPAEVLSQLSGPLEADLLAFRILLLVLLLVGTYFFARTLDRVIVQGHELAGANAQLAQASRHKTEFLRNMSHELRTPLNTVLGFGELLREQLGQTITDRQRRYLDTIAESGGHLLQLIDSILDVSRVEGGFVQLRLGTIAVASLLEPVVTLARRTADERGLRLSVEIADGAVRVDAAQIRHVLDNLLANAIKFTPPSGTVALRSRFEERALVLEVADTGAGIPPERAARIFGVFESSDAERGAPRGVGLGLFLSKRLVELHGGAISFESEEGRGTTFRVALPDARVADVAAP